MRVCLLGMNLGRKLARALPLVAFPAQVVADGANEQRVDFLGRWCPLVELARDLVAHGVALPPAALTSMGE